MSSASTFAIERSRAAAAEVESVMGRRPSAAPGHLSRILYIPRHTSGTTHLPVYDVSEQYRRADVGGAMIGSSMFTIRLGLMSTPRDDGTDGASVQYLVDFTTTALDDQEGGGGEVVTGKVQQRVLGYAGSEVGLILQQGGANGERDAAGAGFTVKIASNNPFRNRIPVSVSFPIPDYVTKVGISRNPYFAFSPLGSTAALQWQIHPVEHGPLRYTLATLDSASDSEAGAAPRGEEVRAIYHHIGLGTSLSTMQHSEGILLLPPCRDGQDSAQEAVIVATLLGALWRMRAMAPSGRKASEGGGKKSLFGKLRKMSTG